MEIHEDLFSRIVLQLEFEDQSNQWEINQWNYWVKSIETGNDRITLFYTLIDIYYSQKITEASKSL